MGVRVSNLVKIVQDAIVQNKNNNEVEQATTNPIDSSLNYQFMRAKIIVLYDVLSYSGQVKDNKYSFSKLHSQARLPL